MKTILTAGTWTNFTKTPFLSILYTDSIRKRLTYILLVDETEEIVLDYTGTEIYSNKAGSIQINAVNETDRKNIYEDIKTILKASNYGFIIDDGLAEGTQKNKFIQNMRVEITD